MFTGIVEELGTIVAKQDLPDALRLTVRGPLAASDAGPGDSIAVNGVCLTVVELHGAGVFTCDVMQETSDRSTMQKVEIDSAVNLERAVTVSTRLGGHIVQGHVDGTGVIVSRERSTQWEEVWVSLPWDLARYVALKGSITIDGVSLTVSDVAQDESGHRFQVSLIPTTLSETTLGTAGVGTVVNLEVDVIAKYLERLAAV